MSIKNADGQIYSNALGGALMARAIEYVTEGFLIINSDHAQHHKGNGYRAYIETTNLASGSTLTYNWHAGADVYCHFKNIRIATLESSITVEILRDATVTVDTGTAVPFNNTNGITTKTAQSTLKASPTYTGGTSWHKSAVLAESTRQTIGAGDSTTGVNDELVFAPDTDYIIKITNTGSSTATEVFVSFFMYEEGAGLDGN